MKVLLVTWNFPPRRGGIEHMMGSLSRELARLTEIRVLTSFASSTPADEEYVVRCRGASLFAYLRWLFFRLPREVARWKPDVILSSGALVASATRLALAFSSRPQVVLVYGTDLTYPNRFYQWWLKQTLPHCDRILAISRATQRLVLERGITTPARLARLHPGVNPLMLSTPEPSTPLRATTPVLLFVGRLIPRKGVTPFLERCLPRILERADIECWIVGDDPADSLAHAGGEMETIRSILSDVRLRARVRLLGQVDERTLCAAYRAASLLLLPAIEVEGDVEGFGIVFLEAALFGVPAVASRIGGIPDAVQDGHTGILVEPGNWVDLADIVVELLKDPERLDKLGRNARERALTDFTWERQAQRLHQLLAEVSAT